MFSVCFQDDFLERYYWSDCMGAYDILNIHPKLKNNQNLKKEKIHK